MILFVPIQAFLYLDFSENKSRKTHFFQKFTINHSWLLMRFSSSISKRKNWNFMKSAWRKEFKMTENIDFSVLQVTARV